MIAPWPLKPYHQLPGEPLKPAAIFWLILITTVSFSGEG